MNVLLLTGKKAEEIVRKKVGEIIKKTSFSNMNIFVKTLSVDVASFITPKMVKKVISKEDREFEYIIVPGTSPADFSNIDQVYKGCKNAYDIPQMFKIGLKKLSPSKPLEDNFDIQESFLKDVKIPNGEPILNIGKIGIGGNSPPKILAEIVDATSMQTEKLENKSKTYIEKGADIIDLGIGFDASAKDVKRCVKNVKNIAPVSIDTNNSKLIEAGIEAGANLILSVDREVIEDLGDLLKDVTAVVISQNKDIKGLFKNIRDFRKLGGCPIADPILDPPLFGLSDSIRRYIKFRNKDKKTPLLFGTGNVTELIDADSHGINAVLASIASEISCDILFTTEASLKTKHSISELNIARDMAYLGQVKNSPPKDVGPNLIRYKEKSRKEFYTDVADKTVHIDEDGDGAYKNINFEKIIGNEKNDVALEGSSKFESESSFGVSVDRKKEKVYATYYTNKGPAVTFLGTSANSIMDFLIGRGFIKNTQHISYLSMELKKAEIALKIGKNYIQDEALFLD